MNQTPLKKIIKISSFFLLTLMTYIIYYQALNPYSVKKFEDNKNINQTEQESTYRIGSSQVNDFQKIGNFALAIDKSGEVQRKDGYIIAQNYRLPKDSYSDEGKVFYDKKNTKYFYQIDIYKEDEGIQSLRKVDIRALLLKEKKKYSIKSTAKLDVFDTSPDAPYIEIELEEIEGDYKKSSLIIDLNTLKSRITHYLGASQEEILTANGNSELTIARTNPVFTERLKSLSFVVEEQKGVNSYDKKATQTPDDVITMRPYQGGELINLYQEYPHVLEMAKRGSFTIYPIFKYNEDSTEQASNFANLFNYPGEESFWSAQKKQDYEIEQTLKQKKDLSTPLTYSLLIKNAKEEGKLNWTEGLIPIGFDIDSEEIVTVDFKKGPVYTQYLDLYSHIKAIGELSDFRSVFTSLNQASFDQSKNYGLGIHSKNSYRNLIEQSKQTKTTGPLYINWLQYKPNTPLSESDMNTVKGIVEQGPLYKIFSVFSLEDRQMTISQATTTDNLVAGETPVMVQNGNQVLPPLQFQANNLPSLSHDEMIKSGRIVYVLIDGQFRQVKVPEEK